MPPSVALAAGRLSRRSLCLVVTLALGLTCLGLSVLAATTPMAGMAGMAGMTDTSASATRASMSSAPVTVGLPGGGPPVLGSHGAVPPGASPGSPQMSSICDSPCVTDVGGTCLVAGGLVVTSLLALLLPARRDVLLSERTPPPAPLRRRRRYRPSWTVLSPLSLCVSRV